MRVIIAVMLVLLVSLSAEAKKLRVDFSFDESAALPGEVATSYKLYVNGMNICTVSKDDIKGPGPIFIMECPLDNAPEGTNLYTMTGVASDGKESPRSPEFIFNKIPIMLNFRLRGGAQFTEEVL